MTLDQYIAKLQELRDEFGGSTPVKRDACDFTVAIFLKPRFMKILNKRESRNQYWSPWQSEDCKGERVIAI
jgi:hypothetical protein